jgi:hypothetical protein
MPRPNKFGLDYFPLDVNLDDKMELIEAKHGLIGFAVVIKLYQNIYKNGYFMDATEEHLLLFKKRVNVDINLINEIVKDSLKWGVFDEKLYQKRHILTSRGIQKRFIEASKRRQSVDFIKEYILIENIENLYPSIVNVNINSINVDINQVNADTMSTETPENVNSGTQSKVKKRTTPPTPPSQKSNSDREFEIFYEAYPKKQAKKKAKEAWKKCNGNRPPLDEILEKLEIQKQSFDWTKKGGQYIPLPASWINGERWVDEPKSDYQPEPTFAPPPYWKEIN